MDTNTLLLELLREVKALREDNKLLHDKLDALLFLNKTTQNGTLVVKINVRR